MIKVRAFVNWHFNYP